MGEGLGTHADLQASPSHNRDVDSVPAASGSRGSTAWTKCLAQLEGWANEAAVGNPLWLLSWVPYGILLGLTGAWFTFAWVVEILLGITGLALAGTEFAKAVKEGGWRGAPIVAWRAMIRGEGIDPVD